MLVDAAADACWALVLTRELLGAVDSEQVRLAYDVPDEVWFSMGVVRHRPRDPATAPPR